MGNNRSGVGSSAVHQSASDVDASQLFGLLLRDDDPRTRRRAAELLGHLNVAKMETDGSTVADRLIEAVVSDDDIGVRTSAIEALYGYGEEHIDRLVQRLAGAIDGGDDAVVAFFRDWLDAEQPELRLVAVSSFRRHGDGEIVSSLRAAFDDPDPRVRSRAVEAYGRRETGTIEPIRPLLDDGYAHVRRSAARALAATDSRPALECLRSVADRGDPEMRRIALEPLHCLDDERTAAVLLSALDDDADRVRRAALDSLLRLVADGSAVDVTAICRLTGERSSAPPPEDVGRLLDSRLTEPGREEHGRTAAALLGGLAVTGGDGDLRRRLVDRLDDRDDRVAEAAAEYLDRLGGEDLEKPLQLLIRDEGTSAEGRRRARSILQRIRDEAAESLEGKSIEYTYVTDPGDYPLDRGRGTE